MSQNMSFFRFKRTDFFPPWREDFGGAQSLCVGTKSRNLGDALVLTSLPEKLKKRYPHLRLTTFTRGFNPVVFANNPAISKTESRPTALYGDDINEGSGHLIELKERFFGLERSTPPRPRLYLSDSERKYAARLLEEKLLPGNEDKPLCLIHPWGTTRKQVLPVEFWDALVEKASDRFRFWQVGMAGQPSVIGCEYYFFLQPRPSEARKLFSVMSAAKRFIGVDSGPMHVARAFDVPSLILVGHGGPSHGGFAHSQLSLAAQLSAREQEPYFTNNHWIFSPLYSENRHIDLTEIPSSGEPQARAAHQIVEEFLST